MYTQDKLEGCSLCFIVSLVSKYRSRYILLLVLQEKKMPIKVPVGVF